ncbi:hypothetical protein ABHI18_011486 [Aspergillus niger]
MTIAPATPALTPGVEGARELDAEADADADEECDTLDDDAAPEEDTVGRVADAALEETAPESVVEVLGIDKVVVSRPPPTGGIDMG